MEHVEHVQKKYPACISRLWVSPLRALTGDDSQVFARALLTALRDGGDEANFQLEKLQVAMAEKGHGLQSLVFCVVLFLI